MNEIVSQIMDALIPIIGLIITAGGAYIVALVRRRTQQLETSVNSDIISKYTDMAVNAVIQAVMYTAQTFVDALKAEGGFSKEKQLEAFEMAKTRVYEILGSTIVDELQEFYGDFEVWIETKIEEVCREIKTTA